MSRRSLTVINGGKSPLRQRQQQGQIQPASRAVFLDGQTARVVSTARSGQMVMQHTNGQLDEAEPLQDWRTAASCREKRKVAGSSQPGFHSTAASNSKVRWWENRNKVRKQHFRAGARSSPVPVAPQAARTRRKTD